MQIHPSTSRDKVLNKFINKFHYLLQWPTVNNRQSLCENNVKPPSSSIQELKGPLKLKDSQQSPPSKEGDST